MDAPYYTRMYENIYRNAGRKFSSWYFSLHYGLDNCEIVNGRNQNNVLMEFYMSFQIDSNHEMTVQQLNCSCNKSMPTAYHKMLCLRQINFSFG